MRLSQLTRRMDRRDEIQVCLLGEPIDRNVAYSGAVRGIGRDDPLNRMSVNHVCACEDVLLIEVRNPTVGAAIGDRKSGEP